jgi:hypothetical protein
VRRPADDEHAEFTRQRERGRRSLGGRETVLVVRLRPVVAPEIGEISRAAELAGLSVWDFAQLASERDITWVADDHVASDLDTL